MTERVGSILLGSSQVDEMKRWYSRAFGLTENAMGAFDFEGFLVFIEEHSEVEGPAKEPARCIINLDVDDCRSLAAHLKDMGTRFVRPVEEEPFGLVATVQDPDGNYLQLLQWN